jgi:hypothetical protein
VNWVYDVLPNDPESAPAKKAEPAVTPAKPGKE